MLPDPEQVLHVEDSDEDAALIRHLLRGYPYRISRARTYGEMIDYRGTPDVVLLDLRIPGSNDPIRLVADAVRRFRGAGIILLTGISDTEGEELSVRAMAAGAQVRLIKGTFDRRRLGLAIREAYQQRQHMIRTIEESRADMRVDPGAIKESLREVLDQDLLRRIETLESGTKKALQKLRKLGAQDTEPHEPVPPSASEHRIIADLLAWGRRHQKGIQWIILSLLAAYFAASDYVTGIRDAVFETRDRVEKIEERLNEAP